MKTKRVAAIFILGILLVSAFACLGGPEATPTPTPTPIPGFQTYTDTVNGFSISYPDDWEVIPKEESDLLLAIFLAPSLCSGYLSSSAVFKQEFSFSMSVQTYYLEVCKAVVSDYEGYTSISEEELTVCGVPAIKYVYTYTDTESGFTKQNMELVLVKEQTGWTIATSSTVECWNLYENTFNTIIDSFRLLD